MIKKIGVDYLSEIAITKIGFENFRVFKNLTEFELASGGVTVITGPNNSGKSTILKAIDLLQNSFEKYKSFDIIDFSLGDNNLGSFDNAKYWESDNDEILITTEYTKLSPPLKDKNGEYKSQLNLFRMESRYEKYEKDKGRLKSIKILKNTNRKLFPGDDVPDFLNLVEIKQIEPNKWEASLWPEDIFVYYTGKVSPIIDLDKYLDFIKRNKSSCSREEFEKLKEFPSEFDAALWDSVLGSASIEKNDSKIDFTTKSIKISYMAETEAELPKIMFNQIFDYFAKFFHLTIVQQIEDGMTVKNIVQFREGNPYKKLENVPLKELLNRGVIDKFNKYFLRIGKTFLGEFGESFSKFDNRSFHTYKSLRKYKETEAKEEKMIYLLKEYYKRVNIEKDGVTEGFVILSLGIFGLGDSVNVTRIGKNNYKLEIVKDKKIISIADLGLGSLRVISIILFLATRPYNGELLKSMLEKRKSDILRVQKQIIIIEEPETNLHPAWQSKMAELIVKATIFFEVDIIVETHSEYLIRKLQFLTAKKEIRPEKSVIYYVDIQDEETKNGRQVKIIRIGEDGSLSHDFSTGFFDEADSIAVDLYRMQRNKSQLN